MAIARYLSKLASALSPEGVIPATKGGTGSTTGGAGSGGPKISAVTVTNSSYNVLDDTAVALAGGYIKITGSGFETGCQVLVGTTPATSVTFISATEVRAQVPATTAGTYILYVVNTDGGTAIRVNGITFSATPTWTTESPLVGVVNSAISIQLAATSATTFALASGSSLPSGVSLSSGGLLTGTVTGISGSTTYNFTVLATDAELQDSPKTFAFDISVGDPYFMYNSLLLSANGTNEAQNNTFLDSSTNNFAVTRTGNVSQGTFSPYGSNWSLYTNGTNSYAYLPYSATRSIGTGDFSIECWVYIAKQPANYTRVWSHQSNYGLAGSIGVELGLGTVDTLIQTLVDGNSQIYASATYDTGNGSGHVRQWIHVVSSRQNGYLRIFVNGILREANTNSTNINGTSTTSFGTNSQLGGDLTELYISNFRMCIGSVPTLYSTTSTTAGTAIFTPSTTPLTTTSQGASGVQLLLFQDNRIIDRSSNAFAVTTVNNPSIQRFSPFSPGTAYSTSTISGSAYFDGTGDYLTIPSNSVFQFGTGDFTIECWFYDTGTSDTYPGLISSANGWQTGSTALRFNNIGNRRFGFFHNPTGDPVFSSTNTFPSYQWHHVAVTRSGSTMRMFVNGVQEASISATASISLDTTTGVVIGSGFDSSSKIKGYVSNVRIVKGTAVYTSAFIPPTAPVTAVANTSLLCNFTNASIIDSTMQNNVETVADAKISTTQSKFGGSSIYFDGAGDYCFLPKTDAFLFRSGDFTVELWSNIGDTNNRKYILGPGTNTASHISGFGLEIWGQQLSIWASSNGTGWNMIECDTASNRGSTFMATNTWYHIAVTRSGNTIRSFINGVLEKTFTVSGSIFSDPNIPYNIGRSGYDIGGYFYFNGYMDDIRVIRGVARYTANFTPPTLAALTQ
jgi:hypothetical protein